MYPLKLKPALKDYIWGGNRLPNEYGIESDLEKVAEAWVLSCHPDGQAVISNGEYSDMTLCEYLEKYGGAGSNSEKFEFFPILVKLIDAKKDLSIQVHPSDEYALKNEGQFGKTEMWYVVDCDKGAYLYYGLNRKISKEEFSDRIKNNTLLEVLNRVPVKKGDCFFIESGTIHAIGAGLLIAEIQQNSNLTYRVYDYNRKGADGKPRELHIEKAIEVTTLDKPSHPYGQPKSDTLASCKYFTAEKLSVDGKKEIFVDGTTFLSLICIDGTADINGVGVKKGDSIFLPAGIGDVVINGNAEFIVSKV